MPKDDVTVVLRGGKNPVIAKASVFKQSERLDVRHYFTTKGGEHSPSEKGVNVSMEELDALVEAIRAAGERSEHSSVYAPQRVHVYLNEWNGATNLHIRHFYVRKDGEEAPTKAGVSLPASSWSEVIHNLKTLKAIWNGEAALPVKFAQFAPVPEIGKRVSMIEV